MNWEAIGAIGEIAGAIAVVATLYYLARQIKQQNRQAKRAESNTTFAQFSGLRMALATDKEFAEFLTTSLNDPSSLSESDLLRQNSALSELVYISLNYWDREQKDEVDAMPWSANFGPFVAGIVSTNGGEIWWHSNKSQFPEQYIADVEDAVRQLKQTQEAACPIPQNC